MPPPVKYTSRNVASLRLKAVVPALAILFDKTPILCVDTLSADLTVLIMLNPFIFYKVVCRFRAKFLKVGHRSHSNEKFTAGLAPKAQHEIHGYL